MSPELAALAVHDLKNELGVLDGLLCALETKPSRHRARHARMHCEQLRREMVAFLTLYRGEGLRAMVDDESPHDLLQALAESAQATAPRLQIRLGDCADAPSFWYLDARLVRLALDAALSNACRHATSQVWLDASLREGCLVLSVDDDGPGLVAGTGAHDGWSTGLGTELCRAAARAHYNGDRQGEVRLFDKAEGGARFELILP